MIENRLLATAVDQFGKRGFEGASTREIARASGTAMSSITYHFGGKKGLYLAAADHIAVHMRERLGPLRERAEQLAADATREDTEAVLLAMLDAFAQTMLRPESAPWARFMAREQQEPTEGFARLWDGGMKGLAHAFLTLVGRCRPDLVEEECRAITVLLFGQALVLRVGRASVCHIMERDGLDEQDGAKLRGRLARNARCILREGS
ncbi:MAG: CerR family C-terminal domain-containing protein [Croceibacterium sp.]